MGKVNWTFVSSFKNQDFEFWLSTKIFTIDNVPLDFNEDIENLGLIINKQTQVEFAYWPQTCQKQQNFLFSTEKCAFSS